MASDAYAPKLPKDITGMSLQEFPSPKRANARYGSENAAASSVISLNDQTSALEITAIGGPAVMRWVTTSDTQASVISAAGTANFDHTIPSGALRRFVVPREVAGAPSLAGINTMEGLYKRVAIKSVGTASVLLAEF